MINHRNRMLYPFFLIFISFRNNFDLIWQLGKREVAGRYRGSFFGLLWSFVNPLFLLAIYTLVFGFVFKAKFGVSISGSKADFAITLFSGLIIHQFFAECLAKAPELIVSNPNYVKKVIFPLEVLPWSTMISALFHLLISLIVLLVFYFYVHPVIHWTLILFPVVLLPLVILTLGISWFLAALGVFVRDMSQLMVLIITIALFLSPTFYPITNIPLPYRHILYLNPITYIIIQAREVVLFGRTPDWLGLLVYLVIAFIVATLGLGWFQKTRHAFADVL